MRKIIVTDMTERAFMTERNYMRMISILKRVCFCRLYESEIDSA